MRHRHNCGREGEKKACRLGRASCAHGKSPVVDILFARAAVEASGSQPIRKLGRLKDYLEVLALYKRIMYPGACVYYLLDEFSEFRWVCKKGGWKITGQMGVEPMTSDWELEGPTVLPISCQSLLGSVTVCPRE